MRSMTTLPLKPATCLTQGEASFASHHPHLSFQEPSRTSTLVRTFPGKRRCVRTSIEAQRRQGNLYLPLTQQSSSPLKTSLTHKTSLSLKPSTPLTPATLLSQTLENKTQKRTRRISPAATANATSAGLDAALPSPPAGFILNEQGEVTLMAPESKRLLTLVDETVGRPLECVVRRSFVSSNGLQFFLLYPLDVPIVIYRVSSSDGQDASPGGLIEIDDEELQAVYPTASYSLARRNFHLVLSGFVLTVRGAVCFNQDDVSSINVQSGVGIGSDLSEGVEIASFAFRGKKYVVYTPFDPLLFPAFKDPETGRVVLAEDEELLDDPKVDDAIAEEQEYQRMVNEEEDMSRITQN